MDIDRYLMFEKENDLFKLEVNGFKYWHYIRNIIYEDIHSKKNNLGQPHTSYSEKHYYKRVLLKLKQIPNWMYKNPFWALKEKDILVLNHQRRVKNGDFFDCIYTDEILHRTNYSYYVFEQPILEKHFSPVRTKELKYLDYLNFKVAINVEFKRKFLRLSLPKIEKEKLKKILKKIEGSFNVNIDYKKILNSLEIAYISYKPSRNYYNKILDRINPKIIIELVSYSRNRFIVNELAKERGIPTIELQHGTMGKHHIAYNFSEKMDLDTFPDYILTFGQYWKDNTRLPIEDDKVKVVGWPYFEKKVSEYKQKNDFENTSKKTILFISQGTIGKELSQIAVDIFNVLDKNHYKVIYKLHPGEYDRWKYDYPWLVGTNIEVIDHNHKDMHFYFAKSDIQIGVYSTALFEGLGYDLQTIIIKLAGYELMEELFSKALAELAENEKDIIRILNNDSEEKIDFDTEYFWESNSLYKMNREIEEIIKMSEDKWN